MVGDYGFATPGLLRDWLGWIVLAHAITLDSRFADLFGSPSWELGPVEHQIVSVGVSQIAVVSVSVFFADTPSRGEFGGHGGSGELVAVEGPAAAWGGGSCCSGGLRWGWGGRRACGWGGVGGWGVFLVVSEVGDDDRESDDDDAHGDDDDAGCGLACGCWWWVGLVLGLWWVAGVAGSGLGVDGSGLGWLAWVGVLGHGVPPVLGCVLTVTGGWVAVVVAGWCC